MVTCQQWVVGSGGAIDAQYTLGGVPIILVPSGSLDGSGMCGSQLRAIREMGGKAQPLGSKPDSWARSLALPETRLLLGVGLIVATLGNGLVSGNWLL